MGETQGPLAKGKQSHSVGTFSQPGHMWAGLQDGSSWGSHMPLPFPVAALLSTQISVPCSRSQWRERAVEERPAEGLAQQKQEPGPGRLTSESKDATKTFGVETGTRAHE